MGKFIDLTGLTFNRWTVIKFIGKVGTSNNNFWECKCLCGTIRILNGSAVKCGITKSCGCLQHGHSRGSHNMYNTPEYCVWCDMKARCYNPKANQYKDYGGRGIKVCDRWLGMDGFINFFTNMGSRPSSEHSLDKINNNGNYEKSNCRWATEEQQKRNVERNVWIEYNGERMIAHDWAIRLQVRPNMFRKALNRGYTFEKLVEHIRVNRDKIQFFFKNTGE